MQTEIFTAVQKYVSIGGLSVLPVKRDGSKSPAVSKWEQWQQAKPSIDELIEIWDAKENGSTPGIGIIGGVVSGGLCVIDFESTEIFEAWKREISLEVLRRCPIVKTPRGNHVYFRCVLKIGCRKLARKDAKTTLVETKAEGGYIVAPGSPADCHPLKREYVVLQGDLCKVPLVAEETAEQFLSAAEQFNEYIEPVRSYEPDPHKIRPGTTRPGDDFDTYVQWDLILAPHGWKATRGNRNETRWRRPGGRHYTSAVTNHFGKDELIVFSTEAHPFEIQRAYTKFSAYTLLNFSGDFRAAAKELAGKGYGKR